LCSSRPEDAKARIRDAVIHAVLEEGFSGLETQAICARAHVSEATFLEFWPDGWAALLAMVDERTRIPVLPDTGSLVTDLVIASREHLLLAGDPSFAAFMLHLMAHAGINAELRRRLAPDFTDRRTRNLTLITRAVARGELPAHVDGNAIIDALLGRTLAWMGSSAMPTEAELRGVVEQVVAATRRDETARRGSPKEPTPPDSHTLYLFEASSEVPAGPMASAEALQGLTDSQAIDEADARRHGRYAELWKDGHLLRIFDPE
jgi:AcrR family transcriptional regulator